MKLFQHNREAYEAAVRMLAAKGKACVIHPTGTGKSYIGFALCLDHPDKRILWLSPSSSMNFTAWARWSGSSPIFRIS